MFLNRRVGFITGTTVKLNKLQQHESTRKSPNINLDEVSKLDNSQFVEGDTSRVFLLSLPENHPKRKRTANKNTASNYCEVRRALKLQTTKAGRASKVKAGSVFKYPFLSMYGMADRSGDDYH